MKNWGFITITENQRLGLIGGYLVLNHLGRPLEFHCTTPVRANRAQEILYGTTLDAFLYGEQIAQTLIRRAKVKPFAIVTDRPKVLTVQEFVEMPICYIHSVATEIVQELAVYVSEKNDFSIEKQYGVDSVLSVSRFRWSDCMFGRYKLVIPELVTRATAETMDELKNVSSTIDFLEPFERIRLAIDEAQKAA